MDSRSEAKIQKEIRRRAFQLADALRQERQLNVNTQHTIVALQDVTGLQRPDLDSIADVQRLPAILKSRGYTDEDVANIMHGNFVRFLHEALP